MNDLSQAEKIIAMQLFAIAKEMIACGQEDFVCIALSTAAETPEEGNVADYLRTIIVDVKMEGCYTLGCYLMDKKGMTEDVVYDKGYNFLRNYRLNWIDEMVAELQA